MSEPLLLARDENGARVFTLNRPEKRNALSLELLHEMEEAFDRAAEDATVRTVIIAGAGKGFCAGIDLGSLAGVAMGVTPPQFRRLVHRLQEVLTKLSRMEKPSVAVLHGFCLGMATELALACDARLAEAGCEIHIAEARLGMIPDVGGSTRLVRAVGLPRAKELIMTGKSIAAETAAAWGLVNELVPTGQGLDAALRWHGEYAKCGPLAVGMAKVVLDRAYDLDASTSMMFEGLAQSTLYNSEDFREGVMARMQKRTPEWKCK
jgi:enoyl-CoA hydratase/carnithine racemase